MKWLLGVAALLVAFLAWGAYLSNTKDGKDRATDREAMAACRHEQNDELQELAVRRTVREVCDKMEAEYVAKWGSKP